METVQVEVHGRINRIKSFFPECSRVDIKNLISLGKKYDEAKVEIFVFLSEYMPLLVVVSN